MSDPFDPYYFWLGIPPKDQPPNHYRLLGLDLFESNATAIDNAAERQMIHLRQISTGPRGKIAQELLNQVARARITLLDPAKKAEYDGQLRKPPPDAPAAAGPPSRSRAGESPADAPVPPASPPPIRTSHRSASQRSTRSYQYAAIGVLIGLCVIAVVCLVQALPKTKQPAESASHPQSIAQLETPHPEQASNDPRPPIESASPNKSDPHNSSTSRDKTESKPVNTETPTAENPPAKQSAQKSPERPEKSKPMDRTDSPGGDSPVESKAAPTSDTTGEPLLELPATVDVPADTDSPLTLVAAWRSPPEQLELDIVDRFADVPTDASYRINREPSGTGMLWKIAFVPGGDKEPDQGVVTLAEMSCERAGGPFVFRRTIPPDGLPAAAQLVNCLIRFKQQGKTVMVALRKPVKAAELLLNLHENKATKALDLPAMPKASVLELQAEPLRDLPEMKPDTGGDRSVAIGKPLVLQFNDVPEASIELKLIKTTMNRLALSVEPVFQVPNVKPQPLTFQQVESTFRNSDSALAKAKKELENWESALTKAQASRTRQNQQALNRMQQTITQGRQVVKELQNRDETATKLRELVDAMDKKASIAYRVVAKVDDLTTLVLLTTEWPEAASKPQLTSCFPLPSEKRPATDYLTGSLDGYLVLVDFRSAKVSE